MADQMAWEGRYTRNKPADGWQNIDFDDSSWRTGQAAFGTDNNGFVRTQWTEEHSDIYVCRTIDITEQDLAAELFLVFSHDDACQIYVNGTQVGEGEMAFMEGIRVSLDGEKKKLLKPGKNVIAMHCYNNA